MEDCLMEQNAANSSVRRLRIFPQAMGSLVKLMNLTGRKRLLSLKEEELDVGCLTRALFTLLFENAQVFEEDLFSLVCDLLESNTTIW